MKQQAIQSFEISQNGITVALGEHRCRIMFVDSETVRVHYAFSSELPPHRSYAVLWKEADSTGSPLYTDDETHCLPKLMVDISETDSQIQLVCGGTRVLVAKSPFHISVIDGQGHTVHQDLPGMSYKTDVQGRRYHYFLLDATHYYGFGDKTGELNKFGRRMRMYSCDTMGFDARQTDPLYKHIPFFVKFQPTTGTSCGMFYDCTEQSVFDMGSEKSGYWDRYGYFCCDGGALDYYVITGQSIREVVRGYTRLTGTTAMPTLPSLGYIASTMYYTEMEERADEGVKQFVNELERQGFACDGFHMSSGYTSIDNRRYVFNWNKQRFPDPSQFIQWMQERGIRLSPNIKPALLTSHPLYEEFRQAGAFLLAEDGQPYLGRFWGGLASFVDFSSPSGRAMWKKHMHGQLLELGITDIWDDNNEYELEEDTISCHLDGNQGNAKAHKPVFANLMAKTAIEALREHDPAHRPYVLTRAGYAGIQRYAQTWTGDNETSWQSLRYNIPIMLGLGLSGVANQGSDIGGFDGPAPSAELFVRWVQNGIFQPRFSIHSCNTDNTVTQPWSYPAVTDLVKEAFSLRYSLGLYLYSLFYQAHRYGDPIMLPMVYAFPDEPAQADNSFDFMFGPNLLAANVLEEGATHRTVDLPCASAWYDFHTHRRYEGGQHIAYPVDLSSIPLFYSEGCILPLVHPGKHMCTENFQQVRLLVEVSKPGEFTLYQDDGNSNRFHDGHKLLTTISQRKGVDGVTLDFAKEGDYPDGVQEWEIQLVGSAAAFLGVALDGRELPIFLNHSDYETCAEGWLFDMGLRHTFVRLKNPPGDFTLFFNSEIKNLVGPM